ncbi:RNA-directed DNA polymerase, eukaryota [Tanacetum coccineum]
MNFMSLNVQGLAQKAKKDWVKELCVKNKVNFMGLQETKMRSIDLSSVRSCWGNSNFDYVHSDFVGNSGGILCIWDPNSFRRSSFTRSNYFVIVRGVWLKSGIDLMIVVVYAPQEAKEKRMLWDYLAHVSNQWVGKLVMMGDFNEVRYKSDRYGSNFNAHDAEIFNSFIYNAGLDEVPLGGSAYTWCLKSASKMSKLDRFFVFKNLLSMCPNNHMLLPCAVYFRQSFYFIYVKSGIGLRSYSFLMSIVTGRVDGLPRMVRDFLDMRLLLTRKIHSKDFMGKLKFLKDRDSVLAIIHRSNFARLFTGKDGNLNNDVYGGVRYAGHLDSSRSLVLTHSRKREVELKRWQLKSLAEISRIGHSLVPLRIRVLCSGRLETLMGSFSGFNSKGV